MAQPPPNPTVDAPPHVLELLSSLHARSLEQEATIGEKIAQIKDLPDAKERMADLMRDKFIALEQDKCEFVYTLLRATGALNVVEAGTSFGVSTIYLALAVSQNLKRSPAGSQGRVIATEHEPEKARQARAYWAEAGAEVARVIELREGDLLQTLKTDMPSVDFLLLDSASCSACDATRVLIQAGCSLGADGSADAAGRASPPAPWRSHRHRQYDLARGKIRWTACRLARSQWPVPQHDCALLERTGDDTVSTVTAPISPERYTYPSRLYVTAQSPRHSISRPVRL